MADLIQSWALLLTLLNPFLIIIYLLDVIQNLTFRQFNNVLLRAGVIASLVFFCFVILGDTIFSKIMQVEFASFQIFGGLIFLFIGLQFVFKGPKAIEILQGKSAHLAGAIAMPVLIGPGTISACVVIGKRHDSILACGIVLAAVIASLLTILILKKLHDYVRTRNEPLIERYIEIAGRVTALYIGTVAIEMIMQGTMVWVEKF
ncbi:MAG: MarC family protein [Gammaproteobacteria bacterium]